MLRLSSPMVEATDLKSVKCGFKSHDSHDSLLLVYVYLKSTIWLIVPEDNIGVVRLNYQIGSHAEMVRRLTVNQVIRMDARFDS